VGVALLHRLKPQRCIEPGRAHCVQKTQYPPLVSNSWTPQPLQYLQDRSEECAHCPPILGS
jgi:hypothetical protein